jgi:protein involved in polysaccharide export with SLBB domain
MGPATMTQTSLMPSRSALCLTWRASIVALTILSAPASAQSNQNDPARRNEVTRRELESLAVVHEQGAAAQGLNAAERASRRQRAADIRERLAEGDYQVGDRIVIAVEGTERPFKDTVEVREGQVISIPGTPDISLRGVLRSEIEEHLTRELQRYVKAPVVRSTSLIRLTVLGAIGRPGFYSVASDNLVSEVIMRAGGPQRATRFDKSEIRRGDDVVVNGDAFEAAIRQGRSLDELGLRDGDELVFAEKKNIRWMSVVQAVSVTLSLTYLIIRLLDQR